MNRYITLYILLLLFSLNIHSGEVSIYTQSILSQNNKTLLKNNNQNNNTYACYIHFSNGSALNEIENLGVRVNRVTDNIATIRVPQSLIYEIANIKDIERIEIGAPVFSTLNNVRTDNSIDNVHNAINIPSPYTGKGVIVGIIDQGIQLDHINFYNSNGELRIKRYWNQTDTLGNAPEGFDYGSEYTTQAEIEGIKYDTDNGTHGIHVAGIATGGYKGCDYYGVATESDIVFVSYDGYSSSISDAISYIYDYASEVDKPAVINISIGSFIGPRDGTSDFDIIADGLQGDGKILVGAAGNSGATNSHVSKTISSYADTFKTFMPCSYNLYSYTSQNIDYVEIYGNENTNINIKLSLYNKTTNTYVSQSSTVYSMFGTSTVYNLNNGIVGTIEIYSETLPNTRKPHILIVKSLTQTSDDYAIEISINSSKENTIHAWSYRDTFVSYGLSTHTSGDTYYSINEVGGTGNRIISVGSYVNKPSFGGVVGSISSVSSKGPTTDGRQKPDVTAPGEGVVSSFSNSSNIVQSSYYKPYLDLGTTVTQNGETYYYGIMSGTSMATPVVTGVIATWLEARPTLSPEEIKDIIIKTSRRDEFTGETSNSDNIWGYGKIDAWEGIKECLTLNGIDGVEPITNNNVIITHNKSTNNLKLLFTKETTNADIKIYDITGKAIYSKNISRVTSGEESLIDTSTYKKGIYIIRVIGECSAITNKFIVP